MKKYFVIVIIILFISSCASTINNSSKDLDFAYENDGIIVKRFSEYKYSDYIGVYKDQNVLIEINDIVTFNGKPLDLEKEYIFPIAESIAKKRVFLNIELYNVELNSNIDQYIDFQFVEIDKERMLRVYKKKNTSDFDWDQFILNTDEQGFIKEINLIKSFESKGSMDSFFKTVYAALERKFIEIRSYEQIRKRQESEIELRNNKEITISFPESTYVEIKGTRNIDDFIDKYYYYFKDQMERYLSPEIEAEFQYIINEDLSNITLMKIPEMKSVVILIQTNDVELNEVKKNNYILEGF
jgi:hypothetical protein